jgi:hypothetical protein
VPSRGRCLNQGKTWKLRPVSIPLSLLSRNDRVVAKINAQDTGVSEKMQTIARQNGAAPVLGRLKERIGWFEEAYEEAMKAPAPTGVLSATE